MTIAPAAKPAPCDPPTPLERNRFFPRKLMEVRHWQAEQAYHRRARELVTRLSTGTGVLCGLEVTLTDAGTVVITSGVAVDGYGRLIVVPEDLEVDPSRLSGASATDEPVTDGAVTVSVCHRECGVDPVPLPSESCGDAIRTVPGMIRESYCVRVTPGVTERSGLPDGLCEATGSRELDAEARRALIDRLDPRGCACAEECVPLAGVTFVEGDRQLSTAARTVIRSNRELLDLILCLADRLNACCGDGPTPVSTPPRVTGLWPLPDTDGIALRAFAETRLLEIAFDQDMAEQSLDLPEPWLGVWLLPEPALNHVVQATRLSVTRSGAPLTQLTTPAGGDAAVYEVELPNLRPGDLVLVMVRSTLSGAIRANGATGVALDADLEATTLIETQRDLLWGMHPGEQINQPGVAPVPMPPLPSGNGTPGGALHLLLTPGRAAVEGPPRLLSVEPAGGWASEDDWNKLRRRRDVSIVVSRELDAEALHNPKEWLRMWHAGLDGDMGYRATEVELTLKDSQTVDGVGVRYTFAFEGLPDFKEYWQVLWQLRSGPATDPGAPLGATAPTLLLDADFAGTALHSQDLFGVWQNATDEFPFLKPDSTAGEQLWDDTAGGLAHWGLTTRKL